MFAAFGLSDGLFNEREKMLLHSCITNRDDRRISHDKLIRCLD